MKKCFNKKCDDYNENEGNNCESSSMVTNCESYISTPTTVDTTFVPDKDNPVWVRVEDTEIRVLLEVFKNGTCRCLNGIGNINDYEKSHYKKRLAYKSCDWESFTILPCHPDEEKKKRIMTVAELVKKNGKYLHKEGIIKRIVKWNSDKNEITCIGNIGNLYLFHKEDWKWSTEINEEPKSLEVEE